MNESIHTYKWFRERMSSRYVQLAIVKWMKTYYCLNKSGAAQRRLGGSLRHDSFLVASTHQVTRLLNLGLRVAVDPRQPVLGLDFVASEGVFDAQGAAR